MVGFNPVLTLCGDALLISIEQLLHLCLHMYWLCLRFVGGVGLVFLYGMVWHLGSGVARWDATMVACARLHSRICLWF